MNFDFTWLVEFAVVAFWMSATRGGFQQWG